MNKSLILIALGLGLAAPVVPAHAQASLGCGVNYTPVVGINCANVRTNTYTASILKMIPEATTGTDFFCIESSAKANIHIRRVEVNGSGTAIAIPVSLVYHPTPDTASATPPTSTVTAFAFGGGEPAATATFLVQDSTSGNPTQNNTNTFGQIRTGMLGVAATTIGVISAPLAWQFGTSVDAYDATPTLTKGSTAEICLTLNGTSATALLNTYMEWTED